MATRRTSLPSAEVLEVWHDWLRAHRLLVQQLDRELRERAGVTLDDYDVLVQLAQAPARRLRMSALAGALLLARSSCTRIVGRLEDRGWVKRTTDEDDGRVVWAELTAKGRGVQRRAALVHLRGVQAHFGRHLGGREAESIGAFSLRVISEAP